MRQHELLYTYTSLLQGAGGVNLILSWYLIVLMSNVWESSRFRLAWEFCCSLGRKNIKISDNGQKTFLIILSTLSDTSDSGNEGGGANLRCDFEMPVLGRPVPQKASDPILLRSILVTESPLFYGLLYFKPWQCTL